MDAQGNVIDLHPIDRALNGAINAAQRRGLYPLAGELTAALLVHRSAPDAALSALVELATDCAALLDGITRAMALIQEQT